MNWLTVINTNVVLDWRRWTTLHVHNVVASCHSRFTQHVDGPLIEETTDSTALLYLLGTHPTHHKKNLISSTKCTPNAIIMQSRTLVVTSNRDTAQLERCTYCIFLPVVCQRVRYMSAKKLFRLSAPLGMQCWSTELHSSTVWILIALIKNCHMRSSCRFDLDQHVADPLYALATTTPTTTTTTHP